MAKSRPFPPPTDPELRAALAETQTKLSAAQTSLNDALAAAALAERRSNAAAQERDRAQQRADAAEAEAKQLKSEPQAGWQPEKARDEARAEAASWQQRYNAAEKARDEARTEANSWQQRYNAVVQERNEARACSSHRTGKAGDLERQLADQGKRGRGMPAATPAVVADNPKGLHVNDLKRVHDDELEFSAEDGRPLQGKVRLKLNPIREKTCYTSEAMQSPMGIFWAKASACRKRQSNYRLNIYSRKDVLPSEFLVIIQQDRPLLKCGNPSWNDIDICARAKRVPDSNNSQFIGYDRLVCGSQIAQNLLGDGWRAICTCDRRDRFSCRKCPKESRVALVSDSNFRCHSKASELLVLPKCGNNAGTE